MSGFEVADLDRHVLGDLLTEAHASVIAFADDVLQTVVHVQFEPDVGILVEKGSKPRPYVAVDLVVAGGQPDGARRLVSKCVEPIKRRSDLVEKRTDAL